MPLFIQKSAETIQVDYLGVLFDIARGNNRDFRDKLARLIKKETRANGARRKNKLDFTDLSAEQQDRILAEAYAGTVLVGWKNFEIDGKTVPFNEENAVDLLFHDELARDFIVEQAQDFDDFIQKDSDDLLKKSSPPTTGG